jgi:hypothetical protein
LAVSSHAFPPCVPIPFLIRTVRPLRYSILD